MWIVAKIKNNNFKIFQKEFSKKLKENNIIFYEPAYACKNFFKGKIIETDAQRSIRAYEVKYHTKKSLYDWFKNTKSKFQDDVFFKIYIDYPRPKLIERIASRSEQMLKDGAINEVKRFLKLKIKKDNSSNKVIGIAEIKEYLENKLDLKEVHEKISIKTRQYAKRQSTWARGQMSSWNKINSKDLKKFLKKI